MSVNDQKTARVADAVNDNLVDNAPSEAKNSDNNNQNCEEKKTKEVTNISDDNENISKDNSVDEIVVDNSKKSTCDTSENNQEERDDDDISITSTNGSDSVILNDENGASSDMDEEANGLVADMDPNQEMDSDTLYNWYRMIRMRRRNNNPDLPSTVTKLKTKEGAPVYIVGTAHFSLESQEDVAKTIGQVMPDVIVLELCKSRMAILDLDEETIMAEAANMNLQKVRDSISQNGFFQGLMYLLLLSLSAKVTKSLGMAPGGEFRRAAVEARKNCGCIVQLGDRPIHVTIQRALAALSWRKSFSLGWQLLFNNDSITREDVEKCKEADLLEKMISDMTGQYPELTRVFVSERDKYLAHQLQVAAHSITFEDPEEFERNPTVVVGVVGIGHVAGIVANWETVTREDIIPLMAIPKKSKLAWCVRYGLRISVISLAVLGLYKIMPSYFKAVIPSVSSSFVSVISQMQ